MQFAACPDILDYGMIVEKVINSKQIPVEHTKDFLEKIEKWLQKETTNTSTSGYNIAKHEAIDKYMNCGVIGPSDRRLLHLVPGFAGLMAAVGEILAEITTYLEDKKTMMNPGALGIANDEMDYYAFDEILCFLIHEKSTQTTYANTSEMVECITNAIRGQLRLVADARGMTSLHMAVHLNDSSSVTAIINSIDAMSMMPAVKQHIMGDADWNMFVQYRDALPQKMQVGSTHSKPQVIPCSWQSFRFVDSEVEGSFVRPELYAPAGEADEWKEYQDSLPRICDLLCELAEFYPDDFVQLMETKSLIPASTRVVKSWDEDPHHGLRMKMDKAEAGITRGSQFADETDLWCYKPHHLEARKVDEDGSKRDGDFYQSFGGIVRKDATSKTPETVWEPLTNRNTLMSLGKGGRTKGELESLYLVDESKLGQDYLITPCIVPIPGIAGRYFSSRLGASLMHTLVRVGNARLVDNKLMKTVIDFKWNAFGRRKFIKQVLLYIFYLMLFISMVLVQDSVTKRALAAPVLLLTAYLWFREVRQYEQTTADVKHEIVEELRDQYGFLIETVWNRMVEAQLLLEQDVDQVEKDKEKLLTSVDGILGDYNDVYDDGPHDDGDISDHQEGMISKRQVQARDIRHQMDRLEEEEDMTCGSMGASDSQDATGYDPFVEQRAKAGMLKKVLAQTAIQQDQRSKKGKHSSGLDLAAYDKMVIDLLFNMQARVSITGGALQGSYEEDMHPFDRIVRCYYIRSFVSHFGDFWNLLDAFVLLMVPILIIYIFVVGDNVATYCVTETVSEQAWNSVLNVTETITRTVETCTTKNVQDKDTANMEAITIILAFPKLLFYLRPFRRSGPLVKMVLKQFIDMKWFFLILTIVCMGCYFAFSVLMKQAPKDVFPVDMTSLDGVTLFMLGLMYLAMGDFASNFPLGVTIQDSSSPALARMLMVFFFMLVTLVMFNLIIAIMADSYASIQENSAAEFQLEKAATIVEIESIMTEEELSNKHYFPEYVHVLVPTEFMRKGARKNEWGGTVNAIKTEIDKMRNDHARSIKEVLAYVSASTTELRDLIERVPTRKMTALERQELAASSSGSPKERGQQNTTDVPDDRADQSDPGKSDEWARYDTEGGEDDNDDYDDDIDTNSLAPKLPDIAKALFYRYDLDHSGTLERDELQMLTTNVSYKLGVCIAPEDVDTAISDFFDNHARPDEETMTLERFVVWFRQNFKRDLVSLPRKGFGL